MPNLMSRCVDIEHADSARVFTKSQQELTSRYDTRTELRVHHKLSQTIDETATFVRGNWGNSVHKGSGSLVLRFDSIPAAVIYKSPKGVQFDHGEAVRE